MAWRRLKDGIAEKEEDITNEDEVRTEFIDCLTDANHFGYTFEAWQERGIVISVDGEDVERWPDVQLNGLVVFELKAFFKNQTHGPAKTKKLIETNLQKLKRL